MLLPLNRTRRSLARLLALALCLFNSSLATALAAPAGSKLTAGASVAGEIAVIDAIVVNNHKQSSATPDDVALVRSGTTTPIGVNVGDKLFKGDELTTKEQDQVTLRFVDVQNGELNLVYMDNNSKVGISSACLKSGRILAWVGINFRFCVGNTNLSVQGTQFVVAAGDQAPPKVVVLSGEVDLAPQRGKLPVGRDSHTFAEALKVLIPVKVKAKEEATITPTEIIKADLPEPIARAEINEWSVQMIRADPTQTSDSKTFKNFKTKEERDSAFIAARFDAVWNNDATALETVAKVYNDWERGDKATEVLQLAANRDPGLRTKYDFQTNLAEADRLSGRYASAINHANEALKTKPNDDRAAYIGGKAASDSFRVSQNGADLVTARQFFATALQKTSEESSLNKLTVERELNEVLRESAGRYRQVAVGYDNSLDCVRDNSPFSFSGNIDLPELDAKGLDVSGRGTLYFLGNQFKLISKVGKIFTGTFITKKFRTYTSVALRFDRMPGDKQDGVTVLLSGQGNCNRLRLQSSGVGGIFMAR